MEAAVKLFLEQDCAAAKLDLKLDCDRYLRERHDSLPTPETPPAAEANAAAAPAAQQIPTQLRLLLLPLLCMPPPLPLTLRTSLSLP